MGQPAIYIMANKRNGTLYTGVTSDLSRRVFQHREGQIRGFTKQYDCKMLVYYQFYEEMAEAIAREKQIKGSSRLRKLMLIDRFNPEWKDLYADLA
jgi:putative endonuclease